MHAQAITSKQLCFSFSNNIGMPKQIILPAQQLQNLRADEQCSPMFT